MFLRCPFHQLRVEYKFIDHASRPPQQLEHFHRSAWLASDHFEGSCWIVELNYSLRNTAVWWSRVTVNIGQPFSYFCCAYPFLGEKLVDSSILSIWHFWCINERSLQKPYFSYERGKSQSNENWYIEIR